MLGITFVVMLVAIDSTVVGTALPTIVAALTVLRRVCLGRYLLPAELGHHRADLRSAR